MYVSGSNLLFCGFMFTIYYILYNIIVILKITISHYYLLQEAPVGYQPYQAHKPEDGESSEVK